MRVMRGWSGEVAPNKWAKNDTEADETDLQRLADEYEFDIKNLTVRDAYLLLSIQTEIFILSDMYSRGAAEKDDIANQVVVLQGRKTDIINRVKYQNVEE